MAWTVKKTRFGRFFFKIASYDKGQQFSLHKLADSIGIRKQSVWELNKKQNKSKFDHVFSWEDMEKEILKKEKNKKKSANEGIKPVTFSALGPPWSHHVKCVSVMKNYFT